MLSAMTVLYFANFYIKVTLISFANPQFYTSIYINYSSYIIATPTSICPNEKMSPLTATGI